MKKFLPPALMTFLLITLSLWLSKEPAAERYTQLEGSFAPTVHRALAADWAFYKLDLRRNEQVYCITKYRIVRRKDGQPLIHVEELSPATEVEATPVSVSYNCGPFPSLHTHPPADCELLPTGQWVCTPLAPEDSLAYCFPSDEDVQSTRTEWHRFGVIQCTKDKFVFFSP